MTINKILRINIMVLCAFIPVMGVYDFKLNCLKPPIVISTGAIAEWRNLSGLYATISTIAEKYIVIDFCN